MCWNTAKPNSRGFDKRPNSGSLAAQPDIVLAMSINTPPRTTPISPTMKTVAHEMCMVIRHHHHRCKAPFTILSASFSRKPPRRFRSRLALLRRWPHSIVAHSYTRMSLRIEYGQSFEIEFWTQGGHAQMGNNAIYHLHQESARAMSILTGVV